MPTPRRTTPSMLTRGNTREGRPLETNGDSPLQLGSTPRTTAPNVGCGGGPHRSDRHVSTGVRMSSWRWHWRARFERCRPGSYGRPFASLYLRSTSAGIRPRAGTAIPFSVAQARITLGSRLPLAERVNNLFAPLRRDASPLAETGRPTFQYLSKVRDREARFRLDRSSSRQSPFHPSVTVCAPSDPSRSSMSTSTVALAIGSCLSIGGRPATLSAPSTACERCRQPGSAGL
jgi:hypothetical protein